MPNYTFRKKNGKEFSQYMKISELDEFLENNKDLTCVPSAPLIGYTNLPKPPDHFRDRLREIKKTHRRSTINTF